MKYYFFRDIDNESNLLNKKTYHAAGLIYEIHCELNKPNYNGKDFAVSYFEPFKGIIINEWRAISEIELFKVDEWEYNLLIERHNTINIIKN